MASYSQPFELYDVDVADVVFTLLCHTSTNVIEFLFLCAIQNRGPPAPKPRATHPNSAGPSSKAACHPSKPRGPPAPTLTVYSAPRLMDGLFSHQTGHCFKYRYIDIKTNE